MKILNILLVSLIGMNFVQAQATKVAILDFENTSGKTEYDALAKAISSMLITDLANNIHPKKVEFFERSQLNKLLDEQKLQKSKDFDTKTAVDFGKLSGVNYVFVGSVFVMDKTCNFSSKLVDVQTSKIILSKDVSGNIEDFLKLKTQLAEAIAIQLNNPITLDPAYKDQSTTLSTINQYGKILTTMDQGDMDKAEQMRSLFEETNPDFKYFQEIKDDIEELKKQVAKNTADIKFLTEEVNENVTDYLELGYKYSDEKNFAQAEKYFLIGFNKVRKSEIVDYLDFILALSELYYNNGKYMESLKYSEMGLEVYPYFKEFMYFKYNSLVKLNRLAEFDQIVKTANEIRKQSSDSLIIACLKMFSEKNKVNYYAIEKYLEWKQDPFSSLIKAIRFRNYIPFYSEYGGEYYFNENFADPFNTLALGCIQEVYNEKPEHAASLLKQLDLSNSSSEVKFSVAWYTMLSADFTNAQKQWDEIVLNSYWRISDCADYGETMMVKAGISGEERDTIKLKKPFWYYDDDDDDDDGIGFVTSNPIKAYIFKANLQYPIDGIIDCIKSSGCINWKSVSESDKMAIINWGHSHLLSGDNVTALKIYQIFPSDFEFSEDFQNMTYAQVLNSDWIDFEKLGLVSKDIIDKIKQLILANKK